MVQADGRVSRAAGHFTHAVDVGGRRRREPADAACESGEVGLIFRSLIIRSTPRPAPTFLLSSSRALCWLVFSLRITSAVTPIVILFSATFSRRLQYSP